MYRLVIIGLWVTLVSVFVPVWPLELVASFLVYICVTSSLLLSFFFIRQKQRSWSMMWAILPLFVLLVLPVQRTISTDNKISDEGMVIYSHNMLYSSDNAIEVAAEAKKARADIVALQEVLPEQVEFIRRELGFRDVFIEECECRVNTDEIALISRYPIISSESIDVDVRGGRMIEVVMNAEGSQLRVIVAHLPVPIVSSTYATRERGFAKLSDVIDGDNTPTIVVGDFNTTLWSPSLRRFAADNPDFKNVATRGSNAVSWCDRFTKVACLRIDHVFYQDGIEFISSEIGVKAGSDHKAIITRVKLWHQ